MHILAEEVLRLKELVNDIHNALSGPQPDITSALKLLTEASDFLEEIVDQQPRPAPAGRAQ